MITAAARPDGPPCDLIPNGSEPRGATVLGIDDDCRLLVRCDGDLAPTAFGSDEIRVIPELGALA